MHVNEVPINIKHDNLYEKSKLMKENKRIEVSRMKYIIIKERHHYKYIYTSELWIMINPKEKKIKYRKFSSQRK